MTQEQPPSPANGSREEMPQEIYVDGNEMRAYRANTVAPQDASEYELTLYVRSDLAQPVAEIKKCLEDIANGYGDDADTAKRALDILAHTGTKPVAAEGEPP